MKNRRSGQSLVGIGDIDNTARHEGEPLDVH
jgi:hypothetical protein